MIEVYTKALWEERTNWPGFTWSGVTESHGQLRYDWDVPFKAEGAPGITFQVWSSIDPMTGRTREEAGDDSIRIVVAYPDRVWKWPKSFWTTREPGWADRLWAKIKKHIDLIVPRTGDNGGRELRRCPDCGGYLLPLPVKRPKSKDKAWYLMCYGNDGPTKCYEQWKGRDGKMRDARWKEWVSIP
jgi:hypothetical protein